MALHWQQFEIPPGFSTVCIYENVHTKWSMKLYTCTLSFVLFWCCAFKSRSKYCLIVFGNSLCFRIIYLRGSIEAVITSSAIMSITIISMIDHHKLKRIYSKSGPTQTKTNIFCSCDSGFLLLFFFLSLLLFYSFLSLSASLSLWISILLLTVPIKANRM